eukprot:tig00001206_g7513.t1
MIPARAFSRISSRPRHAVIAGFGGVTGELSPAPLRVAARPAPLNFTAAAGSSSQSARAYSSDSHPDFQPVRKAGGSADAVQEKIAQDVKAAKVVLYMKGVPSFPQCGFSNGIVQVLNATGVEYMAHNVLADPNIREGIKKFSNWPTIPQLFVDGEFVGGYDIVLDLFKKGELDDMFQKANCPMREEKK